jgi:hypothetical protein
VKTGPRPSPRARLGPRPSNRQAGSLNGARVTRLGRIWPSLPASRSRPSIASGDYPTVIHRFHWNTRPARRPAPPQTLDISFLLLCLAAHRRRRGGVARGQQLAGDGEERRPPEVTGVPCSSILFPFPFLLLHYTRTLELRCICGVRRKKMVPM